jgi:hypothetical protein
MVFIYGRQCSPQKTNRKIEMVLRFEKSTYHSMPDV